MMKRQLTHSLLCLCALLFAVSAQAQTPMTDVDEFNRRLAAEAQTLQSIESDFIQQKYLDVFDEKITSGGKFYYRKENQICMAYNRPLDYLIVINNGKLKIVSDGRKSIVNLNSNKLMNQMQGMLTACMVGDLSKLSADYRLAYFEDDSYYLVEITPVNKTVQAYIHQMAIYLDKKDMSVHRLRLNETATNYTEYEFLNKQFNTLVDETIFAVR